MMPESVEKYLRTKGRVFPLEGAAVSGGFLQAIVIPVFAEREYLPATLASLAANPPEMLARTLVLLVMNNPLGAEEAKAAETLAQLASLRAGDYPEELQLCWIDAASPGRELSASGGVGLARKIGMDSVLSLLDWDSGPLLLSLDADTLVEQDYLSAAHSFFAGNEKAQGAVFSFAHQGGKSPDEDKAIRSYELYMRYHVAGLRMAGSPYAYHSLGSAIACRAGAYVKAGGMREKSGGEDFYFLQALRKTCGPIAQIAGSTVRPSARPSDRVPIGTGPRVRDFMSGERPSVPNPGIYLLLSGLFRKLDALSMAEWSSLGEDIFRGLPQELGDYFRRERFAEKWCGIHANTPKNELAQRAAFHIWFDALKTMQFTHSCERDFPLQYPREKRLGEAFFRLFESSGEPLPEQLCADEKELLAFLRAKNI